MSREGQRLTDKTFRVETVPAGSRSVLLLNPPVYDAQYWARWSQPAGLLRIATLLQQRGWSVRLIDCMEADGRGLVPKSHRVHNGQRVVVRRDDSVKPIYHFGLQWGTVRDRIRALDTKPEQVWIGAGMTYWWESTRDAIKIVREELPGAQVFIGGIYPTLAPEHALERLDADYVFVGEMSDASNQWTDLRLYHSTPGYAILTTTRGCPWDCHYCAARTLNGGSAKMRWRSPEDVLAEIEDKMGLGIRRFGFYEDNALIVKGHLQRILEMVIQRGHRLQFYAPEGFETRMLTEDLLRVMKRAGFEKLHLPFEALRMDTNLSWNRRHASTASFEQALEAAIAAGFKPRSEDINAFVLFGLPDEDLQHVMDSAIYVHHRVGSIVPMLFTPVPGTRIYSEHQDYLKAEGRDLADLNGKFLPFLEYNQERYASLRASDYLQLEALMSLLNQGKVLWRSADLCGNDRVSTAFRHTAHPCLRRPRPGAPGRSLPANPRPADIQTPGTNSVGELSISPNDGALPRQIRRPVPHAPLPPRKNPSDA